MFDVSQLILRGKQQPINDNVSTMTTSCLQVHPANKASSGHRKEAAAGNHGAGQAPGAGPDGTCYD